MILLPDETCGEETSVKDGEWWQPSEVPESKVFNMLTNKCQLDLNHLLKCSLAEAKRTYLSSMKWNPKA